MGGWKRVLVLGWLTALCAVPLGDRALAADPDARATHEAQHGDTLASLAHAYTGDATRFGELRALNPDALDADGRLREGVVLVLPATWSAPRRPVPMRYAEPMVPGSVASDSPVDLGDRNEASVWEELTFFPALRELERDFETLMLRASYNADVDWGAAKVAERQARTRTLLEQEILAAGTRVDEERARLRMCEQAASRAARLLSKYDKYGGSAFEVEKDRLLDALLVAFRAEQRIWEQVAWRDLTAEGRRDWQDFRDALSAGAWVAAFQRHADLERHRTRLRLPLDLNASELDASTGEPVAAALQGLLDLRSDEAYRAEQIVQKRLKEALADMRALEDCEKGFVDAEHFVQEKRRKLVVLQASVSAGTSDALVTDARRVADRFGGILGEVQIVDAWLSNATWAALWWKAGVALRLAGEHELGARRIAQAASVAVEGRLPVGEVPRTVETWLREGENEVLRLPKGLVRVALPPRGVLTVDGRDVPHTFGEAEIFLAPGVHRFVFWVDGSDPIMRLVGVAPGESHSFVWYERPALHAEEEEVLGQSLVRPVFDPEPGPKRWHLGVRALGGTTLGQPLAGVGVSVRYLPRMVGAEVGAEAQIPTAAMWLNVGQEVVAFARLHGAAVARGTFGKVDLVGGLGFFADPFLGAGPAARVEVGLWITPRKLRMALDGHLVYDATPHFDVLPRLSGTGGLSVWF